MISNQTKQKSEILKIAGFALFTPLGRIFIEPMIIINEFGLKGFVIYLISTILIGTIGISFILRSCDILSPEERK